MFDEKLLEKYADLIVKSGVNVQKGQPVIVKGSVDALPLIRPIVKKSYEAGASIVKVEYSDSEITKYHFTYRSNESLQEIPDFQIDELRHYVDKGACSISITSPDPEGMKGVNPEKMKINRVAFSKKAGPELLNYYASNKGQWCVVGYPCLAWAKKVFPRENDENAMKKLWEAILETVRITPDNNPTKEWEKHNQEIRKHCNIMNQYDFKKLVYKNSLGTDLVITLPEGHIWEGGDEVTNNEKKVLFNPNMPTEEIFTCPHRNHVDGIVYATKPLIFSGNIINNFWIKFIDGRIVDYGAEEGKEVLKTIIETDEGSHYIGEVALVPFDSPINNSGILFYNTLYDENASCHLAIGAAYETTVKGTEGKTQEELREMGVNDSFTHVDFMIGSKDLSIVGITKDGKEIEVFKNGNFTF